MSASQDPVRNRSGESTQQPTEFKLARQLTRHSPAEVAEALGVSRSTVSRWESGELKPSQEVLDWVCLNRNQYPSFIAPLTRPAKDGQKREPRGAHLRPARDAALYEVTSKIAKALERA